MTRPLLFHGDTVGSADLFHAIPVAIEDAFTYAELADRSVAVITSLEHERIKALERRIDILDPTELGRDELLSSGRPRHEAELELVARACERLGIRAADVPSDFPLAVADVLRARGIELHVAHARLTARRRIKTEAQLQGIRRAQRAADAAMAEAARLIRELPDGLTCEGVRAAMLALAAEQGCELAEDVIVGPNEQGAAGHSPGSGPIHHGDVVIVDIWPRDRASRCWADMTRTFMAGGAEPPEEIAQYWHLTYEALQAATAAVRPGVTARELFDLACEIYEAAGQPTQRTKPDSDVLVDGFFHSLGHGVGLEVHEAPVLGRSDAEELMPGEVLTIEPGCYRHDRGGVRLEDLVLVTEDGCEVLTDFPYEL